MNLLTPVRRIMHPAKAPPGDTRLRDLDEGLRDAIQTLRWCRKHLQELGTTDALRLTQANIAYLALALDCQMLGEPNKASAALKRVWPHPLYDAQELVVEKPESGC